MVAMPSPVRFVAVAVAALALACSAPEASDGQSTSLAYSSTDAASQMEAIVATARAAASGKAPGGRCYAAVARYIDTSGYGTMAAQHGDAIGSLPAIPAAYGAYAHDFADYANEPGHADALGLTRLALDNPYDAPAGAIVVVRAGTPGTSHPTAGDISIAAGNGVFFNDGTMSYGGAQRFAAGNDYVLGIYVPRGASVRGAAAAVACEKDVECNGGSPHTGRVCGNERVCIAGCHDDRDCDHGQTCKHTSPHWVCR